MRLRGQSQRLRPVFLCVKPASPCTALRGRLPLLSLGGMLDYWDGGLSHFGQFRTKIWNPQTESRAGPAAKPTLRAKLSETSVIHQPNNPACCPTMMANSECNAQPRSRSFGICALRKNAKITKFWCCRAAGCVTFDLSQAGRPAALDFCVFPFLLFI